MRSFQLETYQASDFDRYAPRREEAITALTAADVVFVRRTDGTACGCVFGMMYVSAFLAGDARFDGISYLTIEYEAGLPGILEHVAAVKGSHDLQRPR